MIEEDKKFLKLLEILGHYQEKGSVIVFVDKQEHADGLLKDLMKAYYPCMSLHGGTWKRSVTPRPHAHRLRRVSA